MRRLLPAVLVLLVALSASRPGRASGMDDMRLIAEILLAERGRKPYAEVVRQVAERVPPMPMGTFVHGSPYSPSSPILPALNLLKLLIKARDYQSARMLLYFGRLDRPGGAPLHLEGGRMLLETTFFQRLYRPDLSERFRTGCEQDLSFSAFDFNRHRNVMGQLDVTLTDEEAFSFLLYLQRIPEAERIFRRSFADAESCIRTLRQSASGQALSDYLTRLRWQEDTIYTLFLQGGDVRSSLAVALLRKGRIQDEITDSSRAILRSLRDEKDRTDYVRLRELRAEIARLMRRPADADPPGQRQERLDTRLKEASAIEGELAKRSAPLRSSQAAGLDDVVGAVAKALPPDGAFLEIAAAVPYESGRSRPYLFAWMRDEAWRKEAHYLAFILLPDGKVTARDLGPVAPIDAAVHALRQAIARKLEAQTLAAAQHADKLLLAPVRGELGSRRRLWLSLDDQLHFAPLVAFHDGQDYLLGRYEFTFLTSGRDLLRPAAGDSGLPSAVLMADPAFAGADAPSRLPGSREEAAAVHELLPQARILLGPSASDAALLGLQAPGILHIATHGVFRSAQAAQDPLVRSALALAPARGDGVITAMELASLDLWGTQLVVLSACETGLGDAQRGQGVYGLRRAFFIAGAETLVTSLWRVDDGVTRELMTEFYRQLLRGAGRAQAMTEAAQANRKRHPLPYYWAAFQVLGSAAPLRLGRPGSPAGNEGEKR